MFTPNLRVFWALDTSGEGPSQKFLLPEERSFLQPPASLHLGITGAGLVYPGCKHQVFS